MQLPKAPQQYDAANEALMRGTVEREDKRNQKIGSPVILTADDGSRWNLVVDGSGNLSTVAAS